MHLSPKDGAFFYASWMPLLTWVNDELRVVERFPVPEETRPIDTSLAYKVRSAMWERQDLLDRYVTENPMGATPESLALIGGFRHRVAGTFIALRTLAKGTLFIEESATERVFQVQGITDPLLFDVDLPAMVKCVLLPFGNVIVYDTFIERFSLSFGPGARRSFEDGYRRAKASGNVHTSLGPRPARVEVEPTTTKTKTNARVHQVPLFASAAANDGATSVAFEASIAQLPTKARDSRGSFAPEVLIVADPTGLVVLAEVGRPGVSLERGAKKLARSSAGTDGRSAALRVASPELATKLRRLLGASFEVVVAPTPLADAAVADLLSHLNGETETKPGAESDTTSAMVAAFHGAKALYEARPWAVLPDDGAVFILDVPALGLHSYAASLWKHAGGRELRLYPSLEHLLDAEATSERPMDQTPQGGSGAPFIVAFIRKEDATPRYVEEIKRVGFVRPSPRHVTLFLRQEGADLVFLSAEPEIVLVEAASRAIAAAIEDGPPLVAAWFGDVEYERTKVVPTSRGPLEVRVAIEPRPGEIDLADAIASLLDEPEPSEIEELEDVVCEAFECTDTAEMYDDEQLDLLVLAMDVFCGTFGRSIVAATGEELRRLLFEALPATVDVSKEEARPLVVVLRAFVTFLARTAGVGSHLVLELTDAVIPRLEAALADEKRFSASKRLLLAARAAGVDTHSPEALRRFEGRYFQGARQSETKQKTAADKRAERKATKKARRKNR